MKRSTPAGRRRQRHVEDDLCAALVRLHILHHAAEGPVFGLWIIDELARHGYRLSPGTLYPVLHQLERQGYLAMKVERGIRGARRTYRATPAGRRALKTAKSRVRALFSELFADPRSLNPSSFRD